MSILILSPVTPLPRCSFFVHVSPFSGHLEETSQALVFSSFRRNRASQSSNNNKFKSPFSTAAGRRPGSSGVARSSKSGGAGAAAASGAGIAPKKGSISRARLSRPDPELDASLEEMALASEGIVEEDSPEDLLSDRDSELSVGESDPAVARSGVPQDTTDEENFFARRVSSKAAPRGARQGGELVVVGLVKPLTEGEVDSVERGATELVQTVKGNTVVLPNGKTQVFHRAYSTEESYLQAEQHVQDITQHCVEVCLPFLFFLCISWRGL